MSHGGDHRDLRLVDGPGHPLVVKGPQVLQRTAAPSGDEHVRQLIAVGVADSAHDLRRRLRPLYPHRQQQHLGDGIPAAQNADHVVYRRPRRGGDDGDAPGEFWQRFFVGGIEQPLPVQLVLQLFEGHIQVAHAVGGQAIAIQLVRAVPRVDADAAGGNDLHAVFRLEPQLHGRALEHHAPQRALAVLQRKVVVSGRVHLVVGHLAPQQQVSEGGHGLHQLLDAIIQFGDGKHMPFVHAALLVPCGKGRAQALPFCFYSFSSPRTKLPRMPLMNFTTSGDS